MDWRLAQPHLVSVAVTWYPRFHVTGKACPVKLELKSGTDANGYHIQVSVADASAWISTAICTMSLRWR